MLTPFVVVLLAGVEPGDDREHGERFCRCEGPRSFGGGIDVSYRVWDRYSLFAQYQLTGVENRNFRAGDGGLDHLLPFELTRSFR